MDRLKKINWVRTGFSEIPENVENAIVAFCQKNEIMHIDIIKGRDLQKAIEDIIWDYGIETEFISLLVGYFNSQKEL
ncbi:MAG: hypothetical protein C0596_09550 [Marinilabiliales bacterium]|nr:MAG: hypothetical protein C0596_09550 [Marinilabiliales bacterium]